MKAWSTSKCLRSQSSLHAMAATSNRLAAAVARQLDRNLRHLDVDQAFIQSELDTDIYMHLPLGCGSVSGKVVLINKALYGLK